MIRMFLGVSGVSEGVRIGLDHLRVAEIVGQSGS